jgi:hypothetical protein
MADRSTDFDDVPDDAAASGSGSAGDPIDDGTDRSEAGPGDAGNGGEADASAEVVDERPLIDGQTFPHPVPDMPALFNAAGLALGILTVIKVTAWADLPEDAWRLFEEARIVLTDEQHDLLDAHDGTLNYLRTTVAARKYATGSPGVTIGVCTNPAHPDSWRPITASTAGSCIESLTCKGPVVKVSPLPSFAAIEKATLAKIAREAKLAEGAARQAAADEAERNGIASAPADTPDDPEPIPDEHPDGELDFGPDHDETDAGSEAATAEAALHLDVLAEALEQQQIEDAASEDDTSDDFD